jgi:branched-chain amino acid transport system ATP-binding protein
MTTLRVEGVARAFGGLKAVDAISFSLRSGETVALVGPNGAGKSTVVQLLSGVERIDSGTIHLDSLRIDRLSADRIARLGVLRSFQTSRVFPVLSIWESTLIGIHAELLGRGGRPLIDPFREVIGALFNLPFWRARRAPLEARAEVALKLFGDRLWPRRHEPAFSLSYANRRRLEIARLLASEPRFLLLDEPAAGMNPTETAEMTELLIELRRLYPALGMLVIEHKLSLVRRIADRIIVMNQGRVLLEGAPQTVLDAPEVAEAFIGSARSAREFSDAHLG